jgi:hypothetical protein
MRKFAFCFKLTFLLLVGKGCSSLPIWTYGEVPFVPTPPEVIDRIGSGDGRIIIQAAKKYGVKGVGIEIDHDLVKKARDNAVREKVEHLVEFRVQDAFTADVSPASVLTVYMLPEFNAKLRPMLEKQLRSGSRVVSHDFEIRGWTPDRIERVKGGLMHDHTIFLFEIEAPFAESHDERLKNEGGP